MIRHSVGWEIIFFFSSCLPLTILVNSSIQVCARVLVHPILIDAEEHVGDGRDVNSLEFSLAC